MAEEDVGQKYNHLAGEASPYLQKHATNPVDWYPWGEEAFERARAEDKPIFLSIGYSTCHWCNVMEEESFSDPEVAALMNRTFVSVKVDREERPDIDALYMTVGQLLTGSGGWPLTIVMTPERKPFFAGTYFPKATRFGRIGMTDLIGKLGALWIGERGRVLESAEKITAGLREAALVAPGGGEIDEGVLDRAFREFQGRYDSRSGGLGEGMKFPMAHVHLFLLRYWQRTGNAEALAMVTSSLRAMRGGGIYDHLGYGFHRYATDREWLVPHFEKMLYDQALLAIAYVEAWQATGEALFSDTAREIFTYVLRDMTSPEGGFYSAESADSEGEEGAYYVWRASEIRSVLGPKDAPFALSVFNIGDEGNFTDSVSGERPGTNILHLRAPGADLAREAGMSEREFAARYERVREALYKARLMRERPLKDDKVLTDWNGLMIAALAIGGRALGEPEYTAAAERAADFVLAKLRSPDGGLLHRWRSGRTAYHATLDDYAFLIWGLIELSQTTHDAGRVRAALGLDSELRAGHWDETHGGYFTASPETSRDLIVSMKESDDSALPSGNSVMLLNLLRLARLTGQAEYEERAGRLASAFAARIMNSPANHALFLSAQALALGPSYEIVVVGKPGGRDTRRMLDAFARAYLPGAVVLFVPDDETREGIDALAPFVREMKTLKGRATAYVCRDFACNLPTESPARALALTSREQAPAPE